MTVNGHTPYVKCEVPVHLHNTPHTERENLTDPGKSAQSGVMERLNCLNSQRSDGVSLIIVLYKYHSRDNTAFIIDCVLNA